MSRCREGLVHLIPSEAVLDDLKTLVMRTGRTMNSTVIGSIIYSGHAKMVAKFHSKRAHALFTGGTTHALPAYPSCKQT
jgi:hypothetical protein